MNKWYINGIEMTNRGVFLTSDYTVSSASVSRSVYSGGCASYVATKAKIGLKTIRLPVRIVQESTDMADSVRSWMLSMCLESKVEMMLPNGKTYVAALTDTGEVEKSAEGVIDFTLEFTGYQRGEIGKNIVTGIWNGIAKMGDWLWDQVSSFFSGIVNGVRNYSELRLRPKCLLVLVDLWLQVLAKVLIVNSSQ